MPKRIDNPSQRCLGCRWRDKDEWTGAHVCRCVDSDYCGDIVLNGDWCRWWEDKNKREGAECQTGD